MISTLRIAPLYMQFHISDASLPENALPDVEKIRILFNGQCITVPCAYWDEDETELIVGNMGEIDERRSPLFDDKIPTSSGTVVFTDAEANELLAYPVPTSETRIRIWTDGLQLPERVVVAIG